MRALIVLLLFALPARAEESAARLSPHLQVRAVDLPDNRVQLLFEGVDTEGWRTLAIGTEFRLALRSSPRNDYRLGGFRLASGAEATIVLLHVGFAAVVPFPFRDVRTLEWAVHRYEGTSYVVASLGTGFGGAVFVTRQRDGRTLCLSRRFHRINGPRAVHTVQYWGGVLHFPASSAVFDMNGFDAALAAGSDRDLLVPEATLSQPPGYFERTVAARAADAMRWTPGDDASVLFHPMWQRLGPGLRGADPAGGMDQYLTTLQQLANQLEAAIPGGERYLAAMAAFRLLMPEERIRRELGEPQSTRELTGADYRRALRERRQRWESDCKHRLAAR